MPSKTNPASSVEDMIEGLRHNIDDVSRNLVIMQQKRIPVLVNEYNSSPADTVLRIPPRSRGSIVIKSIVAQYTSNATVTIGPHNLFLTTANSPSPYSIGGLAWIINQDELRQISQASSGFLSLELFGEEIGDVGVL